MTTWRPTTRDNQPPRFVGHAAEEYPRMHAIIFGDNEHFDRNAAGTLTWSFAPDACICTVVSKAYNAKCHIKMDSQILHDVLDFLESRMQSDEITWVKLEPRM